MGTSVVSGPISQQRLPFQVRIMLWLLSQIERFLLETCPRGRFKRSGLAWVDQTYAQARARLERTNGDAHL
jgi:hypothetical protein